MPVLPVALPTTVTPPPADVLRFLKEARGRIEEFHIDHCVPAFVPSDYVRVYHALRTLEEVDPVLGRWFCEWGSGFGVVTCLASMLGYEAWGIEIEEELIPAARQLAADFDVVASYAQGNFLPRGAERLLKKSGGFNWLHTGGVSAYEEIGLDPADFDVIFAYPWPDDERLTLTLFDEYARPGALLLTYHSDGAIRLHRKVSASRRGK